jgi:acyl transferase domain-containing protein/acyl carrier protein
MQGHGLGAGWAMGMFADIVLLSEESRYVSPYMSYGFTPGAGATYILPRTIGPDLARESLLTAQPYTGRDLRERGVPMAVLRRADVYPAAMAMAARIARSPRGRLIALKQQLTQPVYGPLDETVRRELAMHEQTFVGQSDTLAKIQSRFEQGADTAPPAPVPASATLPRGTETLAAVAATLRTLLANELALRESDVDDNIQFLDIGLDSISGVTWVRKINEKYQISIEATKVYSYPTLAQLSRHVKEELDRRGALSIPGTPAADVPVVVTQNAAASTTTVAAGKLTSRRGRKAARFSSAPAGGASEPIAVIGMAGQFPQARNLEEFWRNIAEGRNCISEVPAGRWDVNAYYQEGQPVAGKTNSRWVGALDEYDRFDPLFFNLSPTEAENMDPQQRLFLQACWHSIENAGYDVRVLSGSKCGVFVGCSNADYYQMARQHQWSAQGFTGSAMSILAARISYFLNLQGPCVSIDTACSSSLVALAQACDSLNSGASDLALAGGVYVMAGPGLHVMTAQANMLSPQGRCFTFDQRADGFVPGEGVGVVLLKRLADAQRDQDNIYGIVEGWGLNQDGKTNGITAPNPDSQTRLEQDIYDKFAIDPENIQLIEAHGTGTKLGDPIEVEGLRNAFRKYTRKTDYCALGSVKSNIGHCLTAAGIAGVIKLLLALEHKQLPPTLNFEQLNEHIDLTDSPFFVNTRLQNWDARGAQRRQAAISSFGFSGTNAHIVLGEPPAVSVSRPDILHAKTAIPLSARTPEQLRQKARDLLDYLRQEPRSAGLQEVAYTLQAGRTAMDERLAFEVMSTEQLIAKLDAYVRGERAIDDAYEGQVKRNRDALSVFTTDTDLQQTVEKWIVNGKLSRLLDLWVKGLEVDWNKLYGEVKPRRVALPAYPFAKERYWIDTAADAHLTGGTAPTAVLHPLLHANTSDLGEQRYSSTFTGHELFLADHRVRTDGRAVRKVLPGVAYLEMARAAVERATPARPEGSILELHDTVWLQPLVVSARTEVSIALHATDGAAADYEIYGSEAGQRTVYCEGRARFTGAPVPPRIDVEHLKAQMERGRLEPAGVYATFAHMGLEYGPAHQGITAIHVGERQLLAELRLPSVAETGHEAYELHPSLLDSALQAAIGLADPHQAGAKPYVPFVLESLRAIAPCTREMVAWVRYAAGSKAGDRAMKLDLDVCDRDGTVCVQMRGFVSRILDGAAKVTHEESDYALIPDRLKLRDDPVAFDDAFYQKLIADIVNRDLSVDEAVSLG